MPDDVRFTPSTDIRFTPGIQPIGDGIRFVPSKSPSLIDKAKDIIHEYYNPPQDTKPYPQWFENSLETAYNYSVAPFNKAQESVAKKLRDVFRDEAANPSSNIPGGPQLFSGEGPVPQGFKTE